MPSRSASVRAKRWTRILAPYSEPNSLRSILELVVTFVPLALLWAAVLLCVQRGLWLGLLLSIPAAGFLVRLFTIQHDCGHGSFFRSRRANDAVGRVLGVLTLTPYDYWRRAHAIHHATTGNLDRRGIGDITLLTVAEYQALPSWRRWAYRLSRHPLMLIGLGPVYLLLFRHRLPMGLMRAGTGPWISTIGTSLVIAAILAGAGATLGYGTVLLVHVPIAWLSGSMGIWLFYIQHQFEHTYWARADDWSFHDGALLGSTHYEMPGLLRWMTSGIGIHHVHHLASRIPGYRLARTLVDHPELREVGRLTLRESPRCFRFVLWDEDSRRLVNSRELRALRV